MRYREEREKFELPSFTPIYNGLDEHLARGKMTPTAHSVYVLLLRHCNWTTGVYFGCAGRLEALYGGQASRKALANALHQLREGRMINYREGDGKRGSYNILIHHHLVRTGVMQGFRLDAFAPRSLEYPAFFWPKPDGARTVDGWSTDGGLTVCGLSEDGRRTVIGLRGDGSMTATGESADVNQEVTTGTRSIEEFQTVKILESQSARLTSMYRSVVLAGLDEGVSGKQSRMRFCSYCPALLPDVSTCEAHELFCPENPAYDPEQGCVPARDVEESEVVPGDEEAGDFLA